MVRCGPSFARRKQDMKTPAGMRGCRKWSVNAAEGGSLGTGVLVLVVALLVAGRVALPYYLESYVNRTIDESPDYSGSVGSIDVNLLRAYTIHDLKILKRTHSVPRPRSLRGTA